MRDYSQNVISAKQGDAEAFSLLYAEHYRQMYRFAFFSLGSREEAEDAVMDAVADAFAGIGRLREPDKFKSWIFKILANKIKRRKARLFFKGTAELTEEIADASAEESLGRVEDKELLAAMDSLTAEERDIILLAVAADYTSADIAAALGLNANTVRSKQHRALKKLRDILKRGELCGNQTL